TDHSFIAQPPRATILYGIDIPATGGDTSFCDMRAAYAALPADMKARIDGLSAVHCYQSSRSPVPMLTRTDDEVVKTPDVVHPLVLKHPRTGAKALYMSTTRLDRIQGMERAQSDALIDELFAHATQSRFQYHHKWHAGDMVIWDNLCSMHHANGGLPQGAKRYLHRALLANDTIQ
ncbi:MAG: TauD/TfdA family dioxygenase, partial [Alphaproteobacteria bacterium]|nr:TauD/TfdA family dioxygenase [Alphaproteobacteria bacterium]